MSNLHFRNLIHILKLCIFKDSFSAIAIVANCEDKDGIQTTRSLEL